MPVLCRETAAHIRRHLHAGNVIQYGGTYPPYQIMADFCRSPLAPVREVVRPFRGSGNIMMRAPEAKKMIHLKDFVECHMGISTSVRNRNHSAASGKEDQQDLVSSGAFLHILNPQLGPGAPGTKRHGPTPECPCSPESPSGTDVCLSFLWMKNVNAYSRDSGTHMIHQLQ